MPINECNIIFGKVAGTFIKAMSFIKMNTLNTVSFNFQ